jgi:hypothetical protein
LLAKFAARGIVYNERSVNRAQPMKRIAKTVISTWLYLQTGRTDAVCMSLQYQI